MSAEDCNDQMRLSEAKQMRKRAEEDARLLANRIALLKQEELKAVKKIEETRRKAQEILNSRNRNLEELKKREEVKRQRQSEEIMRLQQNQQTRDQKRSVKEQANQYRINRVYLDAQSVKLTKQQNLKSIEDMKSAELAQKMQMKNYIKRQQQSADERRKRLIEEKKEKARLENEKRIEMEHQVRRQREEEVAKMEQEELELIQRLQNTQLLQKTAYEDLENALSGNSGF